MSIAVQSLVKKPDLKKMRSRVVSKSVLYSNEVTALGDDVLSPLGCAFARCSEFSQGQIGVYSKSSLLTFRPLRIVMPKLAKDAGSPEVLDPEIIVIALQEFLLELRAKKQNEYWLGGNCLRWVHGDADGLPGIVIDEYADLIVMQSSSAAGDFLFTYVLAAVQKLFPIKSILERSSGQTRQMAKLPERTRVIQGEVSEKVECRFVDLKMTFRPMNAQKTGLFLDQAYNLSLFGNILKGLSSGGSRSILDVCSYAGAWSAVAAVRGFNKFYLVDQDKNALSLAELNINANHDSLAKTNELEVVSLHGDLFEQLSLLRKKNLLFDVVVADPPAFAKSKTHVPEALRAYIRLIIASAALVAPGGVLVVCSCSRNVTEQEFFDLVDRQLSGSPSSRFTLVSKGFQSPDHTIPVGESFSHYLKCGFFRKERD